MGTWEGETLEEPRDNKTSTNTKKQNGAVGDNSRRAADVKDKKKEKNAKKSSKKKKGKKQSVVGGSDGGYQSSHGEHSVGTSRLTARSNTAHNHNMNEAMRSRDAVRENVMTQVGECSNQTKNTHMHTPGVMQFLEAWS